MQLSATLFFSALATVFLSQTAGAADSAWLDVEGRIQYGFYTEDTRSLFDIADQLAHLLREILRSVDPEGEPN